MHFPCYVLSWKYEDGRKDFFVYEFVEDAVEGIDALLNDYRQPKELRLVYCENIEVLLDNLEVKMKRAK